MASGGAPGRALLRTTLIVGMVLTPITACTASPVAPAPSSAAQLTSEVRPVVPTRDQTEPTRTPPRQLAFTPAAGSVTVESGPFTDRLEITDLSLQPGDHPSVTAALSNVADVSAVIVLELRADFYDAQGGYLGFGTAGYADQEYADNGTIPLTHFTGEPDGSFTIAVSSTTPLPGAAGAILTVPQLVNE